MQASYAFEAAELERVNNIGSALKIFCKLERAAIAKRTKILETLESAVWVVNNEADVAVFINRERNAEHTHKYSKAISLLDEGYDRRYWGQ